MFDKTARAFNISGATIAVVLDISKVFNRVLLVGLRVIMDGKAFKEYGSIF